MAVSYPCPRCGVPIVYQPNHWAPWRANQPFRCPGCATMLRIRPNWITQVVRVMVFVTILAGEAVMVAWDPMSRVHLVWLAIGLFIAVMLLMLRLTQTLQYILPHRLQVSREE